MSIVAKLKKAKAFNLNKGFTLIELLVVIGIIGVLATLLISQLGVARAKSRDAKRVSDINQVRNALELYFDDNGEYLKTTDMADLKTDKYLSNVPNDPLTVACAGVTAYSGAGCYGYSVNDSAAPTAYQVWAELERTSNGLKSDSDIDSVTLNWDLTTVDGTADDQASCATDTLVTNQNCVFDLGQN